MSISRTFVPYAVAIAVGVGFMLFQARHEGAAPAAAPQTLQATVAAAGTFLGTLDAAQKARAAFPFDSPQKTNWSNLPSGIFARHSLRIGDLAAPQRDALMTLLRTVLSRDGYQKVLDIMEGDEVLQNRGGGRTGGRPGAPPKAGGRGIVFGRDEYYIAILGTPSPTAPWMIQFGGHHLAINVTMAGSESVLTPSLPATQPASFTLEGRTVRPLGDETDKGFALINALTPSQKEQAILKYDVRDLVLGATQDGKTIQPEGLPASELDTTRQNMLLDLAHEWVGILNDEAANRRMADIRANLSKTWFAWSGPTAPGNPVYYRIQGPTLVIEYATQQNDLEHIHTIYRDPTNDYGAGIVKR